MQAIADSSPSCDHQSDWEARNIVQCPKCKDVTRRGALSFVLPRWTDCPKCFDLACIKCSCRRCAKDHDFVCAACCTCKPASAQKPALGAGKKIAKKQQKVKC